VGVVTVCLNIEPSSKLIFTIFKSLVDKALPPSGFGSVMFADPFLIFIIAISCVALLLLTNIGVVEGDGRGLVPPGPYVSFVPTTLRAVIF